ncbi:MAG: hypothetical protein QF659_09805, partial [Dehalococcoidia bacterium]|nr:hypothetical protein [Dehalococcoidia bacterium]
RMLPYEISLRRVFLMSVLSNGLYLFYWFYLTWKQYREQTRIEAFPVWHALTLMVPGYNLFRIHSHMRSLKQLMLDSDLASTISAGWAVALVLILIALGVMSYQLAGGFGEVGDMTQKTAVNIAILNIISVLLVAGLLVQVQGNLNRYWSSLANVQPVSARIGVGEVIFGLIGGVSWVDTMANVLSSAYRTGL